MRRWVVLVILFLYTLNKIIELQQKLDEKVGSLGDSLLIYSKQVSGVW